MVVDALVQGTHWSSCQTAEGLSFGHLAAPGVDMYRPEARACDWGIVLGQS